ncbi:DUF6973 domain-containing protein [Streptomyces sp. NPDC057193]|uniref:DUF6973 domain-containing protein n=1 Tax=Streptomyces sp. NPDC057193 TaxID=3346043 RepID=UPI0036399B5D
MFSISGLLPEAKVCAMYFWRRSGMMEITVWALGEAKRAYSKKEDSAKQNAYRHCIWQAMRTWEYGSGTARKLGNAHEVNAGNTNVARLDSAADSYNNIRGREIGGQITAWTAYGARSAACARCKKLVNQHKLKSNAKKGAFV